MTALDAAYRAGAERGVLVLQCCAECGLVRHYPQVLCAACHSFAVQPVEASGAGTVHSYTVAHHAFDPAFADQTPYVLVTVDMAEGVRVLGRWDGDPDPPAVGDPVRIGFRPGDDGRPAPWFAPGAA